MPKDPEDFAQAIAVIEDMRSAMERHGKPALEHALAFVSPLVDVASNLPPFNAWKGKRIPYGPDGSIGQYQGPLDVYNRLQKGVTARECVEDFAALVTANTAAFLSVFLVRGVTVEATIPLDEDMWLVPPAEAPASPYTSSLFSDPDLGNAQYLPGYGLHLPWPTKKCGLVVKQTISPLVDDAVEYEVFARRRESERLKKVEKASDVMRGAILAGTTPVTMGVYYTTADSDIYPQAAYALYAFGREGVVRSTADISGVEAVAWYKKLGVASGRDSLRVAIDRLGKARLETLPVEKALDLGLAMEVLLVHDDSERNKELNHKLGLRAGWLLGADLESRLAARKVASELYGHRSAAAHRGRLAADFEAAKYNAFVSKIARTIVDRGGFPEWNALTFGA